MIIILFLIKFYSSNHETSSSLVPGYSVFFHEDVFFFVCMFGGHWFYLNRWGSGCIQSLFLSNKQVRPRASDTVTNTLLILNRNILSVIISVRIFQTIIHSHSHREIFHLKKKKYFTKPRFHISDRLFCNGSTHRGGLWNNCSDQLTNRH